MYRQYRQPFQLPQRYLITVEGFAADNRKTLDDHEAER
jgi:hypothetical protein